MPFESISAILPAYNEEENIENAAKRMADALRSLGLRGRRSVSYYTAAPEWMLRLYDLVGVLGGHALLIALRMLARLWRV